MPPPIQRISYPPGESRSFDEVIDVRSPLEYREDHITGARNLPVLDDAERAQVGTIYKQVSPFEARKMGAALVSRNIARLLETHFASKPASYRPLLYCWRGGQRSGSLATVLNDTGWPVGVIEGGYRAYRRHVRDAITRCSSSLSLVVLNGYTGSGKTLVLRELRRRGAQVLDLEGLALHKGSVFGGDPHRPQPTQKRFESLLFDSLDGFDSDSPVFLEAESSKVGRIHLPQDLWAAMKRAPVIEIDSPLDARAAFLTRDYREWLRDPDRIRKTLDRLHNLVPSDRLDAWNRRIDQEEWVPLITELLAEHYDRRYQVGGEGAFASPAHRVPLLHHDDASVASCAGRVRQLAARFQAESP